MQSYSQQMISLVAAIRVRCPGCSLRDCKICSGANSIEDQDPAAGLCSRRCSSPHEQKRDINGEWEAERINVLIL